MNTKFIGVKDFRQNISAYVKKARGAKERYVVVNRNKPLFELKPYPQDEYLDSFVQGVLKAEQDVAAGHFYTHDEVLKELQ